MYTQYNQIFEEYSNSPNTDFALFLNGDWGSGKTYYINNSLEKHLKRKIIYFSLNGISDLKSIKQQILFSYLNQEYNLNIDKRFLDTVIDIGKNIPVPSINSLFSLVKKTKDSAEGSLFSKINLSDSILVFDDLERISNTITVHQVLGFLFDNFISQNIKVIVVGFEKEILKNLCTNFNAIKEKYFRRTIHFSPNIKELILDFINKKYINYSSEIIPLFKLIIENYPKIYNNNLRTLSFIIDNYIKVFVTQKALIEKFNLQEILFYNIYILSIEFKQGSISSKDLNNYNNLDNINQNKILFYHYKKNDRKDKEKSYDEKFYYKYVHNKKLPFYFIKSIYRYVITGFLDESLFKTEIEKISIDFSEANKLIEKFYTYYELDFSDLIQTIQNILEFVRKNKYNLSQLITIFRYLIYINENDLLLKQNISYIKAIYEAVKFQIKNNAFAEFDYDSYFSHNEYDDFADYKEFKVFIKDSQYEYKKSNFESRIGKITDYAFKNSAMFFVEFNSTNNQIDLLNSIIDYKNFTYFSDLNVRGLYCFGAILKSNIINISNAGDCYYSIKPKLECLSDYLSEIIHQKKINEYKLMKTEEFKQIIDDCIEHLDKSNNSRK